MFSFGRPGVRQFGGVGAMVDEPGIRLRLLPCDRIEAAGPLAERAARFAQSVVEQLSLPAGRGCRIEVQAAPREHIGLGVGTQLGLAVAVGLHALNSLPPPTPGDLARLTGRSRRSSIGTYGFAGGGLLVEAGRLSEGEPSPLVARADFPDEWRFLLLMPKTAIGLFGDEERDAFAALPPVPESVSNVLAGEALLHLLPAAKQADFEEFSRSLYRYGTTAGECFAGRQHGAFLDMRTADLAGLLRQLGGEGVGQSSWGPTLFAVMPDEAAARDLETRLLQAADLSDYELVITRPSNRGARVEILSAA
jgi:beta-RFAP synthase